MKRHPIVAMLLSLAVLPLSLQAHPSTAVPLPERPDWGSNDDLRNCKKPVWPRQALREEQKGNVTVGFLVDLDGRVIDTVLRKSSKYPALDQAALAGVAQCQFVPRQVNGHAVAGWRSVTYHWLLSASGGYDYPTDAMLRNRRKALEGDLEAFYQLALAMRDEFGDDDQAMAMLREAAQRGHPGAIYELADAMWHGRGGLKMNQPRALSYYMSSAELGYADAEFEIAMAYANGVGVMPDRSKSLVWLRKAAEHGNHAAQVFLADALADGAQGAIDWVGAVAWYRKAAEAGDDLAQRRLAQCYLEGRGVARDAAQAALWLRKAADQRQPAAETALAALYLSGDGVPADRAETLRLLNRAAMAGHADAMLLLCDQLAQPGLDTDPAKATFWYHRAAEQGQSGALQRLGLPEGAVQTRP